MLSFWFLTKLFHSSTQVLLSTRDENGVLSFCATVKIESGRFPIEKVFSAIKGMEKRTFWDPLMM